MVGVAGKFAGCETCRIRRVKCGNERPICNKCINTGRHCQGYVRTRQWIIGTQGEGGRVTSHDRRPGSPSSRTHTTAVQLKHDAFHEKLAQPASPLIRVSDAQLNELQILAHHTKILTLEPVFEPSHGSFTLPSLLHCLPSLTSSSPALEQALRALCLIHLGVTQKEDRFVKESALINNKALAKVRMAINNTRTASKIETLAASMCLYLYEQVACTAEKGVTWRMLFQGSSYLVKRRGPSSYKSFPDHHFFVRLFRNDACFDALSRSVSTYLAEPEWLTVPWENIPKSDMDRLFDIQFGLPAIFEREGQLEKEPPSATRTSDARKLLNRCNEIAMKFDDWYEELHSRSKEPLFWFIPRQTHKEGPEILGFDMCDLFPNYIQFVDLNTAFLHLYYWAVLSLFYHKIQHIHQLLSYDTPERSSTSPEPCTARSSPDISAPVLAFKRCNTNASPLLAPPIEPSPQTDGSYSVQPAASEPLIMTFPVNPTLETSSVGQPGPLNPKYSEDSVLSLAYLICKSLPFTLNRTIHSLGPDHSAWPIWCALQVFKRRGFTDELDWCTKMLEVWGRQGWNFGGQMGRVEWE